MTEATVVVQQDRADTRWLRMKMWKGEAEVRTWMIGAKWDRFRDSRSCLGCEGLKNCERKDRRRTDNRLDRESLMVRVLRKRLMERPRGRA